MANRYALLIGTSEYHDERLARLKTPAADLDVLAKLLEDRDIGDYQVKVLLNQPFTTVLKEIVSFLKDKHRDDHLLLYFSGHGILDEGGNLYLATKDTERDLLSATALSNRFIKDEMDRSRSKRQVLVLDCCHSGAFLKGTKGAGPALTQATFEGYGRAVLTAADSIQYALEGDQVDEGLELSLFTHFLVEGIQTGEADRGNDGWIELDEWFDYAFRKVRDRTERQTPRKFIDNQYGELYIARNPKSNVVKPAELPDKLRARMKSEYKPDRLEAIQELGVLLYGDDPSMIMSAQTALEKIAVEDDSLSIRSSAEGFLKQYDERQVFRKAEEERRAREQADADRLATLKAEEERLAREKTEAERLTALKAEEKRLTRERAEAERLAALKAEEERKRAEAERQAALKAENDRQERLKAEAERQAALKAEQERKQAEAERLARQQRAEQERQAREKVKAEPPAPPPVKSGNMAATVSNSGRLRQEKTGAQASGVSKPNASIPRPAIWVGLPLAVLIGLFLVGGLIVGQIMNRQANPGGIASPAITQYVAAETDTTFAQINATLPVAAVQPANSTEEVQRQEMMAFLVGQVKHFKGDPNAPVTIIEFSDFQCPFCGRFATGVGRQIGEKYINEGKVRFGYLHFAFLGQESVDAAEASECAGEQNAFWEYHDLLYERQSGENQGAFVKENLKQFAIDLGLDIQAFNECLDSGKFTEFVQELTRMTESIGVTSAPTFVINGRTITGAQPYEIFEQTIEQELGSIVP